MVIQFYCIVKLRRRTAPRRMRAIQNTLEHSDSERYSEQPNQSNNSNFLSSSNVKKPIPAELLLRPHLSVTNPIGQDISAASKEVTVSRIDLSDNDAYTYDISDYYT